MHPLHQNDILDRRRSSAVQVERLRETVRRVIAHVPVLPRALPHAGIGPRRPRHRGRAAAAFTTKQDLREHYPFGLFPVPLADVARIHASSGRRGR